MLVWSLCQGAGALLSKSWVRKLIWSRTGSMLVQSLLATCTAGVERPGQELLHALHHYALRAEIILADFNLAVSPPTAKLPNIVSCQIFRLYGIYTCIKNGHVYDVKQCINWQSISVYRFPPPLSPQTLPRHTKKAEAGFRSLRPLAPPHPSPYRKGSGNETNWDILQLHIFIQCHVGIDMSHHYNRPFSIRHGVKADFSVGRWAWACWKVVKSRIKEWWTMPGVLQTVSTFPVPEDARKPLHTGLGDHTTTQSLTW